MASASGLASCTTPLVRSTSSISPTSAPFATRCGPFSAARWTTSRSSTRRSRSSSFPAPRVLRQDQMPSTRREPGTDADGREADAQRARHAPPSDADADEASGPGGGPMTPLESTGDGPEEAAIFAPSSYSPLDADASDAPELPRVERAWRDAARSFVRRLHLGLSRRWRPASRGRRFDLRRTLRAEPADRRRGAVAALAAPPAAGAAIRAAGRRQPLDERLRTNRAADGGRAGERHDAGRGVHVLDGAPTRDRRGAASGGGRAAPSRSPASCVGGRHQPSARAFATSCGGSVSAWWDATPS